MQYIFHRLWSPNFDFHCCSNILKYWNQWTSSDCHYVKWIINGSVFSSSRKSLINVLWLLVWHTIRKLLRNRSANFCQGSSTDQSLSILLHFHANFPYTTNISPGIFLEKWSQHFEVTLLSLTSKPARIFASKICYLRSHRFLQNCNLCLKIIIMLVGST